MNCDVNYDANHDIGLKSYGVPNVIRISGIVGESIVDGPGIRYVIFAQGCPHGCEGCHNETALDFSGGREYEVQKIIEEIEKKPLIDGVTFSGGEPFCQPAAFMGIAAKLKEKNINIVTYTGYTYEELSALAERDGYVKGLLGYTDILVDGLFVLEKRDLSLQFKGSVNQRYIDMNMTRRRGALSVIEGF